MAHVKALKSDIFFLGTWLHCPGPSIEFSDKDLNDDNVRHQVSLGLIEISNGGQKAAPKVEVPETPKEEVPETPKVEVEAKIEAKTEKKVTVLGDKKSVVKTEE